MAELFNDNRLRWSRLYSEVELYKAAVRLYTKPLFAWRKALSASRDGKTLYDFARRGLQHIDAIHRALHRQEFSFRSGLALHRNFNGKHRTLYIYPWEERLVDLLLYRLVNRALDGWFSNSSYAYRLRGYGVDRCQREIAASLRKMGQPLYVMKRDFADFFDSLDHGVLMEKLREVIEPGDYLLDLLRQRVRFSCFDGDTVRIAEHGVPFGTAVACLFANVYLTGLDRRLEAIPGVRFFRYADDLLIVSPRRLGLEQAARRVQSEMEDLRLQSKSSHEHDFIFAARDPREDALEQASRFRHLGRDKFRKICNLFRYAFRRNRNKFRRTSDWEKRAQLAVEIAQKTLHQGVRNVAIIDYYLRHVTDEEQLRRLDRWLAEEVLFLAFGRGHKKGHFRRLPFRRLRSMGLPSLVHRRRLILHGHVESPFFIWQNYQAQKGSRATAARPKPPRCSAFSQGPEAAAAPSS